MRENTKTSVHSQAVFNVSLIMIVAQRETTYPISTDMASVVRDDGFTCVDDASPCPVFSPFRPTPTSDPQNQKPSGVGGGGNSAPRRSRQAFDVLQK